MIKIKSSNPYSLLDPEREYGVLVIKKFMEIQTFSPKSYKNLILDILAIGYRFVLLDDLDLESPEKQVILRHDIDYSPNKAVEMAKIDYSLGIHSTFFFLVRGHWYNFLGHYT
jgi:hypothetical protein